MLRLIGLAVVFAGLAAPRSAEASPQDLFGYGGRTPALGMTGASYATGYEAVYANPAGLGHTRDRGIFLGAQAHGFALRLDAEPFPLEPSRGVAIGFHLPLPFGGPLEDRLTIGGAFFTPADALLEGQVRFPEVPQWPVLARSQVAMVALGVGLDLRGLLDGLLDGLSIGAGVQVTASLVGELLVFLDETSAFSSVVETQLLASYAPIVGARYERERFGVGLVYHHELASRMQLDIEVENLPVSIPVLTVGGLIQYDPHEVTLEAYVEPIEALRIIAQARLELWSLYDGPQQSTSASSDPPLDPGFSTVVSPRLAAELTFRDDWGTRVDVRAGVAYAPSPAPPAAAAERRDWRGELTGESVPQRYLDNDRLVLTGGVGLAHAIDDDVRLVLDLYAQVHWLIPRTHDVASSSSSSAPMETAGVVLGGGWTAGLEF